ncbi:MAG: LysR substrate-binding domain-containing protein, partial [Proteobacteria bacterium]|nr:LysR substrate-binding domain-containing protein [Pseudomonadota bacterium]
SLRSFDLNLLVLFDALYRERQLNAAASAVGLSQSAASQALARLRDALGDPLFERRGRGMEPTVVAESLAPTVRDSLRALEQRLVSMTIFNPAESTREFNLGLGEVGELFFFPSLVGLVMREAPHVRLRSSPRTADVQTATLRGEVDLAFDFEPPTQPTLRHVILGSEQLVVIARRGHPRISGSVTVASYLAEPRVRIDLTDERWRRLLSLVGAPHPDVTGVGTIVGTVTQIVSVPAVVAETDALAIVPRSVATMAAFAGQLQIIPSPIPLAPLPVFAYWNESFEHDPGHVWLRGMLRREFWIKG